MPRFAILDHDHPFPHWDFLLESGVSLRTWRLLTEPSRGHSIQAERLPDHRLHYLDYEGPVSGGRGRVLRWDGGTFEWVADTDQEIGIRLEGRRLQGTVVLTHLAEGGWSWLWH